MSKASRMRRHRRRQRQFEERHSLLVMHEITNACGVNATVEDLWRLVADEEARAAARERLLPLLTSRAQQCGTVEDEEIALIEVEDLIRTIAAEQKSRSERGKVAAVSRSDEVADDP